MWAKCMRVLFFYCFIFTFALSRSKAPEFKCPSVELDVLRGIAKLNKFQKSKKKLDRAHPTHPPPSKLFFGNRSLTWTQHSNHNNQQLLAMYVGPTQNTHDILGPTPKYQYMYWLRAILGRFKKNPSETWTHPSTSIVVSDFWEKKFFAKPLM